MIWVCTLTSTSSVKIFRYLLLEGLNCYFIITVKGYLPLSGSHDMAEKLLKLRMTNTNNLDLLHKTSIIMLLLVKVLENNDILGTMKINHSDQKLCSFTPKFIVLFFPEYFQFRHTHNYWISWYSGTIEQWSPLYLISNEHKWIHSTICWWVIRWPVDGFLF